MALAQYSGRLPIAGEILAVYLANTQAPADIYADALLTPLANPFAVDGVTGAFMFWAEETVPYDLVSPTGALTPLPPTSVAPSDAGYVLTQANSELPYGRVLTAGTHVTIDDSSTLGEVIINASGGGTGDVVGPASAVDDRIATFDGVTGKLLQDGGATIAEILAATGVQLALTVDPVSPSDNQVWFFQSGSIPGLALSIRFRKGGVTYNAPLVTIS